jgi:hypothetical protein
MIATDQAFNQDGYRPGWELPFSSPMLIRSPTFLFRVALLALFAMLTAAVMPAASQLVRINVLGKGFPLGEICSVSRESKSSDHAKTSSSSAMVACAFCTLHTDHPAIRSPVASGVTPAVRQRETYPELYYQGPHRWLAWSSASPRGPPTHF